MPRLLESHGFTSHPAPKKHGLLQLLSHITEQTFLLKKKVNKNIVWIKAHSI